MKPFFSIRIDYNPSDDDSMMAFDSNTVRFSLARETERDREGNGPAARNYETYQDMAEKIVAALSWLNDTADPDQSGMLDALFFDLRTKFRKQFLDEIATAAEMGDDDDLDQLRQAIDRGVRRANGVESPEDDS